VTVAQMRTLGPGSPAIQVVSGSDNFAFGDVFTRTVTNDYAGLVAKEMDRFFDMAGMGLALPGNIGGGETVEDTVVA